LPGNCQPQAGAAVLPADGSVDLLERQENAFLLRLGNADSSVPHLEQQHSVVRLRRRPAAHAHLHLAPLGELQRVGQQVAQNLQQAHPIADQQRWYVRVHLHAEKQPFLFGHWRQAGLEFVQQFAQIERLQLELHVSGLDPRQVQDVVDQLQQIVPGTVDDLGVAHLLVAEVAAGILFQLVAENQDAVERRAQLVGHVGEEFRLVAIGDHQLVRLLAQALLGGLAMADIDDDRLHQQFVAAAQRRETDLDRQQVSVLMKPEQLAILSQTVRIGSLHETMAHLQIGAAHRLGDQQFRRLAKQLLPRIAEQQLGLAIDHDDPPLAVEQQKGIRRSFHHVPEALLVSLARLQIEQVENVINALVTAKAGQAHRYRNRRAVLAQRLAFLL